MLPLGVVTQNSEDVLGDLFNNPTGQNVVLYDPSDVAKDDTLGLFDQAYLEDIFCDWSSADEENHDVGEQHATSSQLNSQSPSDQGALGVCLFCESNSRQLGRHLNVSLVCQTMYKAHFCLEENASVGRIMKARKNEMRKRYPSRQNVERQNEKRRIKDKQNDFDALNKFMKNTSIPLKIYRCYQCNIVEKKEKMCDVPEPEVRPSLNFRRDGVFWICSNCQNNKDLGAKISESKVVLNRMFIDGRNIYLPIDEPSDSQQYSFPPSIVLPSSSTALERWETKPRLRPDTLSSVKSGPGAFNVKQFPSEIYEHQSKRILDRVTETGFAKGTIIDHDERKVKLVNPQPNTARVKGTDDYYQRYERDIKFTIYQLGGLFLNVRAELPKITDAAWATLIMQLNHAFVEVRQSNPEDGLVKTEYKVHTNHREAGDCDNDCEIVDLAEYIHIKDFRESFLLYPYLPTSVACIHARYTQLISLIISTQDLKAPRHLSSIQFHNDKPNAELVLAMWPTVFMKINKKIANKEKISSEEKEELIVVMDRNITSSTDEDYLSQTFDISKVLATKISNIAKECQHHKHSGNKCPHCFEAEFPSNITIFKEPPINPGHHDWSLIDASSMLRNFERLKCAFKDLLDELPDETFQNDSLTSLDDFLVQVETKDGFSLRKEGFYFHLKLPNLPAFNLCTDSILEQFIMIKKFTPLSAIYHRSISITTKQNLEIVFRRPQLKDAVTMSYNPIFLLAAGARTEIRLEGTNHSAVAKKLATSKVILPTEIVEFAADHLEFSFEEAIWLLDPTKKMIQRNTKPIFVDTKREKKLTFREPKQVDVFRMYKSIDDGKFYELLLDMHDLYLQRLGLLKMSFVQLVKNFNKGNAAEEENDVENLGDEICLVTCKDDQEDEQVFLPKVLTLESGMKLIRTPKERIICHTTPTMGSEEFIFLNVLLYHPHTSLDQIHLGIEDLTAIFQAKDQNPVRDGSGRSLTKLETVRSRLFPNLNQDLWVNFFES